MQFKETRPGLDLKSLEENEEGGGGRARNGQLPTCGAFHGPFLSLKNLLFLSWKAREIAKKKLHKTSDKKGPYVRERGVSAGWKEVMFWAFRIVIVVPAVPWLSRIGREEKSFIVLSCHHQQELCWNHAFLEWGFAVSGEDEKKFHSSSHIKLVDFVFRAEKSHTTVVLLHSREMALSHSPVFKKPKQMTYYLIFKGSQKA